MGIAEQWWYEKRPKCGQPDQNGEVCLRNPGHTCDHNGSFTPVPSVIFDQWNEYRKSRGRRLR